MIKLAKILYGINSITCIFIGLLHTKAHFSDLVSDKIHKILDHNIVVTGIESNIWDLWQGMSLMMGFLLIIIGLLNLLIIFRLDKHTFPPIGASLIMILMLIGVIYSGLNFFGDWQVYGGIAGTVLQSICLFLSIAKK